MIEARSSISETSSIDPHHRSSTFDDTDDLDLQQRLEKLEREIKEITFENTIFEACLERKKSDPLVRNIPSAVGTTPAPPRPISSSQTTTPFGSYPDLLNTNSTSRADRLARKRSKSRSTQADFRIQLTLEQKLDITTTEYEQMTNEKIRLQKENENNIDQFISDLEWIDNELLDIELSITDFLKLKDSSIDKRTHKLIGEKFIRYFNERYKSRESLINKLRARSSGFKRQIIHIENQLKQKEEMGETLHEVDFNQLKIENKQYLDKIDEKNLELVLFKRQVANVTKILNHYKIDLHMKLKDLNDIQQRIDKQKILYEHAEQEFIIVNYEQNRAAKKHNYLNEQIESYEVPEILDYVRKKALLYNLQRDCQVWKRKVDLVSMALQQSKLQWQELQRNTQFQNETIKWHNEF